MSYDLMVFDAISRPINQVNFKKWFAEQIKWNENHNYQDPSQCSPKLRNWYERMIKEYPAIQHSMENNSSQEYKDEYSTKYRIGKEMIFAEFDWSVAEDAYIDSIKAAEIEHLGFYDLSNSGKIFLHDEYGNFREIRSLRKKILFVSGCTSSDEIIDPSWDRVDFELSVLDGMRNCFSVLEDEKGNYIQCMGTKYASTVEYKYRDGNKTQHGVLGHKAEGNDKVKIVTASGNVTVYDNEIFQIDELKDIFSNYFLKNTINPAYSFRQL